MKNDSTCDIKKKDCNGGHSSIYLYPVTSKEEETTRVPTTLDKKKLNGYFEVSISGDNASSTVKCNSLVRGVKRTGNKGMKKPGCNNTSPVRPFFGQGR